MQTTLWSKCIRYECHGNPKEVLSLCTVPINPNRWDANAVLVRWLASPVNPLDLNIIEGRYSLIRPELPAVAGCEAVGSVERISSNVEHLKVGDRVIRFRMPSSDAANGVWAEWAIVDAGILLKIDPKIDLISAATLAINPPTAIALLREFVTLEVDDWIIQNAANSGVGRAVIQLAKYYGYRTFNLIRSNSASESTKAELRSLGADLVMTEEEFGADLKVNKTALPSGQPRLALNGVGGRSALLISSALARRGVLVTYGGMSKRPSEIATGAFVFNGISAYGFSLGSWVMESENEAKVYAIFKELQHLIVSGKLRPPPARFVPMFEFGEAIENAISHGTKQILLIQPEAGSNKL